MKKNYQMNILHLIANIQIRRKPGMRYIKLLLPGALYLMLLSGCADYDLLDDPERKPEPVELEIIAVTDSSVTVRWTQCRDEDFRQYAVYYGTDDIVDRSDKLADSLSFSVDTVKTVQPLDDLTRYYFRVIVYNDLDNFSVSNIVDTTTSEDMKGKMKLFRPVLNDDGGVELLWTAALEEVERYMVYADTTKTVDVTDSLYATVYSDTTETIEGLEAGHTWRFRIFASSDTAVEASSNTVTLELPEE
jgi:hypothetical protein